MQSIDRSTLQQISGGNMTLPEWLGQLFTGDNSNEPDRWVHEELNYNAQY